MSEGLNRCTIMGNLGDDPDLRFTQGGTSVLNASVAATTRYKDADGEWKDRTEWVRVVVWGKRAEALGKLLTKGSRVYVEGELRTSSWEDKDGGGKRYKTEVHASQVLLCGGGDSRGDSRNDSRDSRERDDRGERRESRGDSRERGRQDERVRRQTDEPRDYAPRDGDPF